MKSRDVFVTLLENHERDLGTVITSMPQNDSINGCLRLALRHLQENLLKSIKAIKSGEYDNWMIT